MSMRDEVLLRIKKDSIPRGEEPTKPSKPPFVGFEGSPSLTSEPKNPEPEIPQESESISSLISGMLSDGPRPYAEVLEAVGGDEDALRKAIREWKELIAYDDGGVWTWEIVKDPVSLSERIGMRFEAEIPDEKALGKPAFTYRGHVLAWQADPPHIKLYAWCTVNLFPGRPLTVDIDSTARLLSLSPRDVREALARLVKDGDLIRSWEKGREWYRLGVRYPVNGGKDETGD